MTFMHLYKEKFTLQMGGSDQWVILLLKQNYKKEGGKAYVLTCPFDHKSRWN
jgi:tyrosyl-tRNA synthetase